MNVDLSPLRRAAMRTDVFVQLVPHGDLGSAEGVHRRHCDLATVETIYLYTYIYTYIYKYIHTYTYIYIHIHIHIYIYIYICVCAYDVDINVDIDVDAYYVDDSYACRYYKCR